MGSIRWHSYSLVEIYMLVVQIHTSRMTMAEDVDLEEFVMAKDELSGADIKVREPAWRRIINQPQRLWFDAGNTKESHGGMNHSPNCFLRCRDGVT